MRRLPIMLASLAASLIAVEPAARACGCFTQPSPATPVVQAGERILFSHDGQNVVAYIQIQYQGRADQFGWIVPLPAIPSIEIGTDELFTELGRATQPTFQLTTTQQFCQGGSRSSSAPAFGCSADEATSIEDSPAFSTDMSVARDMGAGGPAVVQDSIGPFDYAVLKADDRTEMLKWLDDNRYFVPDALGNALTPYVHPGGFFLALKLRGNQSAGDIVPIVVKYKSDLPMIPITLTQVGAIPNMGILVWVLGNARAIPRNYHHTVINELPIWYGRNYQSHVIEAIKEAPGRKAFITEYAGSSSIMAGRLVYPGRFGNVTTLASYTNPESFLSYLRSSSYTFDSTLLAILQRYLPMPPQLIAQGVRPFDYYTNYTFWQSRVSDPDAGAVASFDAAACAAEIQMRVVEPTRRAAQLFVDNLYLTRLYGNLSPEDMNLDPVFSLNPDLPSVGLAHRATLTTPCQGAPWLNTDQGFEAQWGFGGPPATPVVSPVLRRELLREEGPPEVEVDNTEESRDLIGPVSHGSSSSGGGCGGCRVSDTPLHANVALLAGAALAFVLIRRRKVR